MRVKETKRQGRIAHHHTDATVPHIVALPGFSFHNAKISIILLISKFLSDFLPSSIIFLTSFIPIPTPHFIKLSRFCGITFAYSNIICYLCKCIAVAANVVVTSRWLAEMITRTDPMINKGTK